MSFKKTPIDLESPPFGPAVVKRGVVIEWIVEERNATTGVWSPKDISPARWSYKVRTWEADADASPLHDAVLTEGTDAASGELAHYFACGTTAYETLLWEIVEVDNDNADADTNSGQRERVLVRWFQPIIDAP